MAKDPEYRTLVGKHGNMQSSGDGDVATVEKQQCQATWARRVVNLIDFRMRVNGKGLGSMLNNVMAKTMMREMDVAEVCSPPRVVAMAKAMGLRAGWSFDLTTHDGNGDAWDFNKVAMRNKAARKSGINPDC